MVKVTKGDKTVCVPEDYYERVYKPRGWRITTGDGEPQDTVSVSCDQNAESLDEELDRLNTLEQLKGYAEQHGIDVDGITTRKQMRNAIMDAMRM